jgi:hypothetical protein
LHRMAELQGPATMVENKSDLLTDGHRPEAGKVVAAFAECASAESGRRVGGGFRLRIQPVDATH